jgi:hypothetical protein
MCPSYFAGVLGFDTAISWNLSAINFRKMPRDHMWLAWEDPSN